MQPIAQMALRQILEGPVKATREALRAAREDGIADDSLHVEPLHASMERAETLLQAVVAERSRMITGAPFDVADLAREVCAMFQPSLVDSSIELRCSRFESHLVTGEAALVKVALVALVANAIEHTPRGEVLVSTEMLCDRDDAIVVQFTVTDTGFGVVPAMRDRVKRAIASADASSGLALASVIARQCAGELAFESEVGCGATFWLSARFTRVRTARVPSLAPRFEDASNVTLDASPFRESFASIDDRAELVAIFGAFLRESRARIDEIEAAFRREDARAIERSAHALKGSCANFGARRLMGIVGELEIRAHRGSTRKLGVDLHRELDAVREAFDRLFDSAPHSQNVA